MLLAVGYKTPTRVVQPAAKISRAIAITRIRIGPTTKAIGGRLVF